MTITVENVRRFLLERERQEGILKQNERDTIIQRLKELDLLWDKYNISKVYLYGSYADKTFQKYSDIDIAVEPEIAYDKFLHLYSEVNKHFDRDIDIRQISELSFADKVKKTGVLIFER